MQVLQVAQGFLRSGEIDPGRVGKILAGVGGHGSHIAQGPSGIGRGARQALGPEDEQAEHGEDEDLPQPDVEHGVRVRPLTRWGHRVVNGPLDCPG